MIVVAGLGALLMGCAQPAHKPHQDGDGEATLAVYREPAPRPAAALAFSPPLLQDEPALELSRDLRQPSAFVGYPEGVAEFFYVRWDDRQAGGDGWGSGGSWGSSGSGSRDRYERRAISEKVGVLYR
jgi:hypothetical protein